ncbi:uncharacterized protein AB675_1906 [Cyphellophora attinorum]|uniref:F-box domain-containing protein n=1 Tax=Cyphellophora attinorum TaxID=1664694 RepID=A0A0N1H889_9EURO|nr:uncharacterized protein AB675_1906 [Phialophora attinorum]KPI43077.1 hypothetical protein AB675_1906 [Phialophora attinorum]
MLQVTSTPFWDRPQPNLASMPPEILERIITFTLPHKVHVDEFSRSVGWEQIEYKWMPHAHGHVLLDSLDWVPGLFLVSKSFRQIARHVLAHHVDVTFKEHYRYPNYRGGVPRDVAKQHRAHFERLFAVDEQQGPSDYLTWAKGAGRDGVMVATVRAFMASPHGGIWGELGY